MDYTNSIKDYIALEIETLKKLNVEDINKAMNLMDDTRKAGGTIFVFGNGGSSATASHYQNDFNKGVSEYLYKKGEPKFKLLCLNDNVATMMAISNDKKRASSSLRLTLSKYNTEDEVNKTFEVLKSSIEKLRG